MELNIDRLEEFRNSFGENVSDFAKRINLSHAAYYYFIRKERTPNLETIKKMGEALGIDPKALIV